MNRKWLWILFTVLMGIGAIVGSEMIRAKTLLQMEQMNQSHMNSVVSLVKKSVAQGVWSTSAIYTLYEERLLTTSHLLSHMDSATLTRHDSEILDAEQAAVYIPSLTAAIFVTSSNPTAEPAAASAENASLSPQSNRWGPVAPPQRSQLVSEMRTAPDFELLETPLLRSLGLVCMVAATEVDRSLLCHEDTEFIQLKQASGIGPLLDELVTANLHFVALQDKDGVLAASPANASISRWKDDPDLQAVVSSGHSLTRLTHPGGRPHLEGLAPFKMVDESTVLIRVSVDATGFEDMKAAANRRHFAIIVLVCIIELLVLGITAIYIRWRRRHQEIERTLASREEERKHWELIGGLSATVAHEIRNPLATISMTAERMRYEFDIPDTERNEFDRLLHIMESEAVQLNRIVTDFLELGKPNQLQLETVEIADIVAETAELFAIRADSKNVALKTSFQSNPSAAIDKQRFRQMLTNLLTNALDASSPDSHILIEVFQAGDTIHIQIADEGDGMTDAQLEQATEPFVSFKANGTGLGLALVKRLATLHGGQLHLQNNTPRGLIAQIQLPLKGAV